MHLPSKTRCCNTRFISFAAMLTESYQIKHFTGHQFQNSDKTCLSLFISPQSIMHSVSLSGGNEVFELGHIDFAYPSSVNQEEKLEFYMRNFLLHKRSFNKAWVSVLHSNFTLLPLSFGSEKDTRDFLAFSTGDNTGKPVYSHQLNDFRICYSMDADLRQLLEKSLNAIIFQHAGVVNLTLFFNHRSFQGIPVALFIGDRVMEIAMKRNEKLVYYNVFNCSGQEDVLYYLLFAMEQFGFEPSAVTLALAGEAALDGELIKALKKYVKQVQAVVTTHPIKLQKELSQLPGHFYFTLLNQHTCEL